MIRGKGRPFPGYNLMLSLITACRYTQSCASLSFTGRLISPLFSLVVKLLPQSIHHTRTLDQMIHHCPQINSRRIASATNTRHDMKADIILREHLRGGRVYGVQHA